jgi:hypothetical protein
MRARIIAIAFLVACGGDGVDISTNQDNVCGEVAEVACHNMYQCCSEGEIEESLGVTDPRTESECREDISRECARSIASLDFGIDQKHIRFDAKIMNDCLDALVAPSGTCATLATALPWTAACMNSAWIGLVQDGSACLSTLECASKDSVCATNQTCVARPGEGKACSVFGGPTACASGLFCNAGTCRAQLPAGGACTSSTQCVTGLFCDLAAAPSVCATRKATGEACTSSAACTSNQCNPGLCAGTGQTCFADTGCTGACADDSSPCTLDSQCALGTCSGTTTLCTSTAGCAIGSTCVFPVRCNPGDCVGDVVCGERHLVIDYCQAALNDLPVPN